MFKAPIFLITIFLLLLSCKNSNQEKDPLVSGELKTSQNAQGEILRDEYEFLIEAASESLLEVKLGQIAQQKGLSPKIKEFGTTMVNDHSKVQELLKELAASKNVTIPTVPGVESQQHADSLITLQGANFDREYIKLMVQNHEEDLNRYHKEATEGKDPGIKAFASGQLEVLQQHLDMARAIMNTVKE